MPKVKANDIELEYETFGREGHPAIVLIMGLSMQMTSWPDEFCQGLADQGFYVVRFDNRDIGLSEKMHNQTAPGPIKITLRRLLRMQTQVPYTLYDMAKDTEGLMDALSIDQAHVVGVSMGGMIGQTLAATQPNRVLSLTSIMSSTGSLLWTRPKPKVLRHMLLKRPKSSSEEDYLAYALDLWALLESPAYPVPQEKLRERILNSYRRSYYPQGFLRQIAAISATGNRSGLLKKIQSPTLVIHGTDDNMIPIRGGKQTARLIPGARFHAIQGMGHNLPPGLLPQLTDLIVNHAHQAKG
ncbi:MAG: alpha/beta hydrolase [Deltaproteobacteria bacterium]|nr:MAG: alpha/beta hydrolase [Deltaproteobacteria bacterium]